LHFFKTTGARIEVFCLEPSLPHDYVLSFAQTISCRWKCIVGNLKRWKDEVLEMEVFLGDGETGRLDDLTMGGRDNGETGRRGDWTTGRLDDGERVRRREEGIKKVVLKAEKVGELEGGTEIEFSWNNPAYTFSEILEASGNIPIPPYLHRDAEEIDSTVYQTVYSRIKGSVAAPTAGLHFTERVFEALAEKHIFCEELTLHVGAGTFQPVKADTIGQHLMHTEHFAVGKETIKRLIHQSEKIVAVGTTSARTLESLYWIGCKIIANAAAGPDQLKVAQWDPYREDTPDIGAKEALEAILGWLSLHQIESLQTSTQIIILPGYRFRIIDGLVTNFHQPQSTLLLLIAAILGEDWKRVYSHALEKGYRFLSYGDANLYLL